MSTVTEHVSESILCLACEKIASEGRPTSMNALSASRRGIELSGIDALNCHLQGQLSKCW